MIHQNVFFKKYDMIAAKIGKTLLEAYNSEKGTKHNAKSFFEEVFFKLFYDDEKYMQWVTNSPFVQGMKKGIAPTQKERNEKLEKLKIKIKENEPDASIAIGFPSSDLTATTSGQVSSMKLPFEEEDVYSSWIGGGLGIGIQGGLSIYFDNPKILMLLCEGWSVYRHDFLNKSAYKKMRGNQIDTWNGQWLSHILSKDFMKEQPLLDFEGLDTTKDGTIELKTQNWLKVLFGIAYQFPDLIITGYIFSLGQTNRTVGFIPFVLPQINKPIHLYKKLFGENEYLKHSKKIEDIYGSELSFIKCCEMGSIGIKALEPKGLKGYIFPSKEGEVKYPNYKKADDIQTVSFNTYITWIIAMLKNESLWDKAETYAQAFVDFEGGAKNAKKDRVNDVSKVLSSPNRKSFIDTMTILVEKSDSQPVNFLELAEQVDKMPADNFSYFLTLIRFRYAYLKK
jgi:hypothetical protein